MPERDGVLLCVCISDQQPVVLCSLNPAWPSDLLRINFGVPEHMGYEEQIELKKKHNQVRLELFQLESKCDKQDEHTAERVCSLIYFNFEQKFTTRGDLQGGCSARLQLTGRRLAERT